MRCPRAWIALSIAAAGIAGIAIALLGGCEKTPMDVLTPNQAPQVSVSAGPIRDSTNVFIATFNWNADDADGQVEMFRYAIDDTSSAAAWFETDDFELTLFFTAADSARVDSFYIGAATVPAIGAAEASAIGVVAVSGIGAIRAAGVALGPPSTCGAVVTAGATSVAKTAAG